MISSDWLRRFYPHHPLVCDHPALPPAMLLAAKLLALEALMGRIRIGFGAPFLPFLAALDYPAVVAAWPWLLGIVFGAGLVLLGFNLAPRLGAAGVGSALLLDLLASRVRFSNSTLLFDLLLLIIALSGPHDLWRVGLRGQLALLYAGAGINKLLSPDWPSGQFFGFWTREVLHLEWVGKLEQALGTRLSAGLSWLTIGIELSLAVLVCWPRHARAFIALGLAFHVGMLLFTGGVISWVFLRVMLIAYLGFLNGPVGAPAAAPVGVPFWRLLLAWPEPARDWRRWLVWASLPVWWMLR